MDLALNVWQRRLLKRVSAARRGTAQFALDSKQIRIAVSLYDLPGWLESE